MAHDLRGRCRCELVDEIDVVDHEIQNHVAIQTPPRERTESSAQDIGRSTNPRDEVKLGGEKSFLMADLQNYAPVVRERDEVAGLVNPRRDRLLDQDVPPVLEKLAGNVIMQSGRCGNAHSIDQVHDLAAISERRNPVSFTDGAGALLIDIDDGDELAAG